MFFLGGEEGGKESGWIFVGFVFSWKHMLKESGSNNHEKLRFFGGFWWLYEGFWRLIGGFG